MNDGEPGTLQAIFRETWGWTTQFQAFVVTAGTAAAHWWLRHQDIQVVGSYGGFPVILTRPDWLIPEGSLILPADWWHLPPVTLLYSSGMHPGPGVYLIGPIVFYVLPIWCGCRVWQLGKRSWPTVTAVSACPTRALLERTIVLSAPVWAICAVVGLWALASTGSVTPGGEVLAWAVLAIAYSIVGASAAAFARTGAHALVYSTLAVVGTTFLQFRFAGWVGLPPPLWLCSTAIVSAAIAMGARVWYAVRHP